MAQEGGASASSCGRGADGASACEPGRPRATRSHRERARVLKRPKGQGSQREAPVCRRPGAPNRSGRVERPRVFAVAEPAPTPEDRQSERSEVCRDGQRRSTKCRRGGPVAAQRSSGLARRQGGSPTGADGCGKPGGRKGGAKPGPDGRRRPQGGRGRTARQAVHQAGRERRRDATPATAALDAYRIDQ
jgi:hypothetical protein